MMQSSSMMNSKADEQSYLNRLKGLLPPVSYDRNGEVISSSLEIEAKFLSRINAGSNKVLKGITPTESNELLANWERFLGIETDVADNYQFRLNRVILKINETGGLSIPYFIGLAKSFGYTIKITEGDAYIFRAGRNRAGDRIGREDQIWVWYVDVISTNVAEIYFRAGSGRAGDRLLSMNDSVIETIFNDLKPAHTLCIFNYA